MCASARGTRRRPNRRALRGSTYDHRLTQIIRKSAAREVVAPYSEPVPVRPVLVRARDAAIAVALLAVVLSEMTVPGRFAGPRVLDLAAAAMVTLPLAWRRRLPGTVAGVLLAAVAVQSFGWGFAQSAGEFVALLLATYTVAAHARSGAAIRFGVVLAAVTPFIIAQDPSNVRPADGLPSLLLVAVAATAGLAARRRRRRTDELSELTRQLRQERAETARLAIVEERLRISRELHDVLGHSLSVMLVQTGAARMAIRFDPARAEEALQAAERVGRAAMVDLRGVVGQLRHDAVPMGTRAGDGAAGDPGSEPLPALIASMRHSGIDARLNVEGASAVGAAGDITVQRICQEALTNVLKHARAHTVEINVCHGLAATTIEIRDDGVGATPQQLLAGHGLAGMRERVAAHGGSLETTSLSEGGFVVRAELPCPQAAAAPGAS